MSQTQINLAPPSARPRYEILDGLRGVAALMVLFYHIGEGFATSPVDQAMNHGYLAVDFFFVLSGFVIGYAYDSRVWSSARGGMTSGRFLLRRLIRLQPMVVVSVIFGAICFAIQGCTQWNGTVVPAWTVWLSLLLGLFMIPAIPGSVAEVRGNGEMFPLVGPQWSLFFEYIGNIMYALILRRLGTKALAAVVAASGIALAALVLTNQSGAYHQGMGWTMAELGFLGGLLRLSFSFGAGLLLSRVIKMRHIRGAFWICSAAIIVLLAMPYVTDNAGEISILNGIYDVVCTLFIFPALVWLGACGVKPDAAGGRVCEFLGEISYPVYIIHYPLMYLFYWYVWSNGYSFGQVWYIAAGVIVTAVILAWLLLRYYDAPLRTWLMGVYRRHFG